MKNLFQPEAVDEVIARIDKLQPQSQRQWGKMNVAQMLAHCSAALDLASGRIVRTQLLIGRLIGRFVRPVCSNDKPFSRGNPTDKTLIITDPQEFGAEQEQLKVRIRQFNQSGEAGCTKHPHPFFGKLAPHEWGTGMYKHLDHHLRQFGV